MAAFAKRGLGLAEKRVDGLRAMNRMATGARHPVERVLGAADIRPRKFLAMAAKAGVGYTRGGKFGERNDGRFAAVIVNVISARPVTSLAARVLRRLLSRSDTLEVWIFIKGAPGHRVARSAVVVTYKTIGLLLLRTCDENAGAEYCQKQP